jgi:hypothetical protein
MTIVMSVKTSTGQQDEHEHDNNHKMAGQQEKLPHNNQQIQSENIEFKQHTQQRVNNNYQL